VPNQAPATVGFAQAAPILIANGGVARIDVNRHSMDYCSINGTIKRIFAGLSIIGFIRILDPSLQTAA
jgi:hypothetical protein